MKTEESIDKEIARIFERYNICHFGEISLNNLPVEKEIKSLFGDIKSIYVFYLPLPRGFLKLREKRAFLLKEELSDEYINSTHLRLLKILYNKIECISFEISDYLESAGYDALPVPARCVPGEEDLLPFSLVRIAQYAGLGGEGENKCLITPEAGPRIILGAVVTSYNTKKKTEQIAPCRHCFRCADACPTGALTRARERIYFWEKCNMCSLCEIVCPVGQKGRRRMHSCDSDAVLNEVTNQNLS